MAAKKTNKSILKPETITASTQKETYQDTDDSTSSTNIIRSIFYASPYASLPPGVGTAGVTVKVDPDQETSGLTDPVLVIRLRLTTTPTTIGISPGTNKSYAIFQPEFPLATSEPYMVDMIWVESGTPPENINWNDAVASAPVTASILELTDASFDGTILKGNLLYGTSSSGVGAQVNVYALSAGAYVYIGSNQAQGNMVEVTVNNPGYPEVYFISVQSAIPTTNGGGSGSYTAPFTLGPQSELLGIPQAANTVSSVVYDGNNLSLNWALNTIVGCVDPDSSIVEVLADGNSIASFMGGPTSANFPIGVLGQASITVKIATVAQNVTSQAITSDIITEIPAVTNVIMDAAGTTVTADVATVPSGPAIQAYLMDGEKQLAGPEALASGKVSFTYDASGQVGLSVVAEATSSDGTLIGPKSTGAILLATKPELVYGEVVTDPGDNTKWKLSFIWNRLPDAPEDVVSYTINLEEDGTSVSTQTLSDITTGFSIAKSAIDVSKTHTINLNATGVSGGNSPINSWAVLFVAPELASLTTTDNQIEALWTAPTGIPTSNTLAVAYQIIITKSDGTVIYESAKTLATQGAIPLSEISLPVGEIPSVLVNVSLGPVLLISNAAMGAKCSASPILSPPEVHQITVDPLTNKPTLNWGADTSATSYTIQFTDGTNKTGITTNSYQLPTALTVDSRLGFTVESVGASNTVVVTGPASVVTSIPIEAANVISVRYNASTAVVSWDAIPDAKSYNVYVYDNDATPAQTYSGATNETVLSFSLTTDVTKAYTVYVQPVLEHGAGLVGMTLDLFTAGIFLSKQLASDAYPYNYIAQNMAALGSSSAAPTAQSTILYLPELGATSGALGTTAITQDPFTIEPSGNTDLPYKLTIAAGAWAFDANAIRTTILTAYNDFLKDLETPPEGGVTGATPYGVSLVQAAIAQYMPQTFMEILYYSYGFSSASTVGAGYVDLRPGMVLRATISDYINISEYSVPTWIDGYSGATVVDVNIGAYNTASNDWRVGFDSFLSTLSANGALSVTVPASSSNSAQAGIAGSVDLYYSQFIQPFYRVYFPDQITNPSSVGSNATTSNFTIVAADSYTSLLTTDVDPATTSTAYFRGRTVLEVMIKVMVNDDEQLVPIGTSVGNLLEQLGLRPSTTNGVFKTLRVFRSIQAALNNVDASQALGPQLEIRFDWDGLAVYSDGNGLDGMNMPLMLGDQVFTK